MTSTDLLINMNSTCSNTVELTKLNIGLFSDIKKTSYDILFAIPNIIGTHDNDQTIFKILKYICQSSTGLRIFIKSPNKVYSLCANIYGDLWIGSSYGEIRWIYRNPSNYKNVRINIGEPNIIYTKKGLFVFLLDDKVLYYTNDFFDRKIVKPIQTQTIISKYHIQIISTQNTYSQINSEDVFTIGLSNQGVITIGKN
jgi:hypothetical protein